MSSEKTSKTEPDRGRRLLFAVIAFLTAVAVVLIAGVILMQEEIKTLKDTVAEHKTTQGSVLCNF